MILGHSLKSAAGIAVIAVVAVIIAKRVPFTAKYM